RSARIAGQRVTANSRRLAFRFIQRLPGRVDVVHNLCARQASNKPKRQANAITRSEKRPKNIAPFVAKPPFNVVMHMRCQRSALSSQSRVGVIVPPEGRRNEASPGSA